MRIGQIGLDVLRKLNRPINADSLRSTRAEKDQEPAPVGATLFAKLLSFSHWIVRR